MYRSRRLSSSGFGRIVNAFHHPGPQTRNAARWPQPLSPPYCESFFVRCDGRMGHKKKGFVMARVFVTGSADGLGKMAAELLIEQGHKVVLHARSAARAEETRKKVGGGEHIVVGDLSNIAETKSVADLVNRLGRFDAVILNAGIGYREPKLVTVDGLPQLFAVNTLAPYLLTALITLTNRLG